MPATILCFDKPPANARLDKARKRLEATRAARLKSLGRSLMQSAKKADVEARQLLAAEIRDVAEAAIDLVQDRAEEVHEGERGTPQKMSVDNK